MKTVLLSIPKSLNSTIEFIRNLVQVILELLLRLINAGIAGINYNTYDSLDNFFDGFDEQIASCKANNAEKAAIYIASAVARASNDYWNNILSNGPSSPVPGTWTQYLNSSYWPVNYNNLSAWVGASYLENWRGPLHFKQ